MVETPPPREKGRSHTTGAGETPPRVVTRSARADVPAESHSSTWRIIDDAGPGIAGLDEPPPVRDEDEDTGETRHDDAT